MLSNLTISLLCTWPSLSLSLCSCVHTLGIGNILLRQVTPSSSSSSGSPLLEMVILDAGIVSELSRSDKRNLMDLFKAIARNGGGDAGALMIERSAWNSEQLRRTRAARDGNGNGSGGASSDSATFAALSPPPPSNPKSLPGIIEPELFCQEMKALVAEVHSHALSLGRISIGNLLERVLLLCRAHNVKLDARFIQTMLAFGIAEGVINRLDPDMDILSRAVPCIMRAAVTDSYDQPSANPSATTTGSVRGRR